MSSNRERSPCWKIPTLMTTRTILSFSSLRWVYPCFSGIIGVNLWEISIFNRWTPLLTATHMVDSIFQSTLGESITLSLFSAIISTPVLIQICPRTYLHESCKKLSSQGRIDHIDFNHILTWNKSIYVFTGPDLKLTFKSWPPGPLLPPSRTTRTWSQGF